MSPEKSCVNYYFNCKKNKNKNAQKTQTKLWKLPNDAKSWKTQQQKLQR